MNSSKASGIVILLTGMGLLLTTFLISCIHLYGEINVLSIPSFLSSFGDALSSFLEAGIRILYLGLMGWIALRVTSRGITILLPARVQEKNRHNSYE